MRKLLCGVVAGVVACAAGVAFCGEVAALEGGVGGKEIEDSLRKAVVFLRKAQGKDGGWGGKASDVGITGLVLEGLGKAPPEIRKEANDLIESGIKYILANRRDDGSIVNADGTVANYRTSIATRALIAIDREKYKDVIDAAVKYTKGIQVNDPKDKLRHGSIGYGSEKDKGDNMNVSEAVEMLRQAGVAEDDESMKLAKIFVERMQALDEYAEPGVKTDNSGGGIYRSDHTIPGASKAGFLTLPDGTKVPRAYGSATYNLLKNFLFFGMKKDNPRVKAAYQWICDHYTVAEHPEMGQDGLYYFYYTMVRTLELWGSPTIKKGRTEHNWAKELATQIISLQQADGSWVNKSDKFWEADPTLATAYSVLSLTGCHRMLNK